MEKNQQQERQPLEHAEKRNKRNKEREREIGNLGEETTTTKNVKIRDNPSSLRTIKKKRKM